MEHCHKNIWNPAAPSEDINRSSLRADCESCFGFCCTALYFSTSEGFPVDKEAGTPCPNLQSDFRCSVHENLEKLGLKGCTAYDCFGAGQKVAQFTYSGKDWLQNPESAKEMYQAFLIMRQIHEMLWYLAEAASLKPACQIRDSLAALFSKTERLTMLSSDSLLNLDVAGHRSSVNKLLLQASEMVRADIGHQKKPMRRSKTFGGGLDLIGADLRGHDLRGENLRGAYLIAADLRGADLWGADFLSADLRDADIRGTDLGCSIFLTQAQISSARGDSTTVLPISLIRPKHWT